MMDKETINLMEEGYREMAEENLRWAEMIFPLVKEIWFLWEAEDANPPKTEMKLPPIK